MGLGKFVVFACFDRVKPLVGETVRRLAVKAFRDDPIAGNRYARATRRSKVCPQNCLLDHLVSAGEEGGRHGESESFGGLRLTAKYNLVGSSTGMSAGLVPCRM